MRIELVRIRKVNGDVREVRHITKVYSPFNTLHLEPGEKILDEVTATLSDTRRTHEEINAAFSAISGGRDAVKFLKFN